MNIDLLKLSYLLLTLPLASCGGSEGGGSSLETPYDLILGAYGGLSQKYPIETSPVTADQNLPQGPDAGSIMYSGVLLLEPVGSEISGIGSQIRLDVNFADRNFEGYAFGFYTNDGSNLVATDGQLSFTGFSFDPPTGSTERLQFQLEGNLTQYDGLDVQLNMAMRGDFVDSEGSFAAGINGNAEGLVIIGSTEFRTVGDFIAEREQP